MTLRPSPHLQRFFSFVAILSFTFTQAVPAWASASGKGSEGGRAQGCLVFGWSCRQTMNAATNPIKARAATGSKPRSSFIGIPPQSGWLSGVNQVPTTVKNTMKMIAQKTNLALSFPVTNWPIRMMEITNSALRPKMDARYRLFGSLSFTTSEYHKKPLWGTTS